MTEHRAAPAGSAEGGVLALCRAIARGDRDAALLTLATVPGIARAALARGRAGDQFLEEIGHHVYGGDTALHIAAAAYDVPVLEALLEAGAAPGARNRRGARPLYYASDGSPLSAHWSPVAQAAVISRLLRAGAGVDATDASGVTALHRAVRCRTSAAVSALLAGGADPGRANASGSTPLHLAVQTTGRGGSGDPLCQQEQLVIIRLLIEAGADPGARDGRGRTVHEIAHPELLP